MLKEKTGDYLKQSRLWTSSTPNNRFDCVVEGSENPPNPLEHRIIKSSGAQIRTLTAAGAEADELHKNIRRSQAVKEKHFKEYEHQKSFLLSISESHSGFLKETGRKAIHFMLAKSQRTTIIDLTAAYVYVKLGRNPTATEVFSTMLEYDFQEDTIVKLFTDYVKTEPGTKALKSMLNSSSTDHQQSNECGASNTFTHSSTKTSTQQEPLKIIVDRLQETHSHWTEKQASSVSNSDELNSGRKPITTENSLSKNHMIKMLVEKENAKLKDRMLCKICKQRQISVVLLPCGHFVLCDVCSGPCQVCPCCQKAVLAEKKTFLS